MLLHSADCQSPLCNLLEFEKARAGQDSEHTPRKSRVVVTLLCVSTWRRGNRREFPVRRASLTRKLGRSRSAVTHRRDFTIVFRLEMNGRDGQI